VGSLAAVPDDESPEDVPEPILSVRLRQLRVVLPHLENAVRHASGIGPASAQVMLAFRQFADEHADWPLSVRSPLSPSGNGSRRPPTGDDNYTMSVAEAAQRLGVTRRYVQRFAR
jgi:hypothetical protein